MNRLLAASLVLSLAVFLPGCGGSSTSSSGAAPARSVVPADAPGHTNVVPPAPAAGQSRAGQIYSVYISSPTGDTVVFTVFEPTQITGGRKYPLVLEGHGFAGTRQTSASADIKSLLDSGYGVISIDQRGHGETSGTIRVMDPDFEGRNLIAILDWAEARLGWLAYGPSTNGKDSQNLVLGSMGGSYGGMYQYLIHNVDPKHRLDAMTPEIAPSDLTYSLFPNSVVKAGWDFLLFGAGNTAGNNLDRLHFDPFVINFFQNALTTNQVSQEARDFFYYHSNAYFCHGRPVATNGGAGTVPLYAPVRPNDKVNVMLFQGFRDTLFNFNNAYENYQCLKAQGGDVRLLTYQSGHNALQVVPDPGQLFQPTPAVAFDSSCGSLSVGAARLAFFNQHLKGMPGAADKIPSKNCLSLTAGDAVLVDQVTTGKAGRAVDIPATNLVAGVLELPIPVDLGITAGAEGDVIGGIPRLEVDVAPVVDGLPGEPIIFAGIGHMRANIPGIWDLVDNQITPLRGVGRHEVDLAGIAERLAPGDKLALLLYGGHDQYHVTGSLNIANPTLMPVSVTGKVWVPMLGSAVTKAP
ncbi:MAG: CocE/NonD family hydrolase [Pseudomonadota bacterium]